MVGYDLFCLVVGGCGWVLHFIGMVCVGVGGYDLFLVGYGVVEGCDLFLTVCVWMSVIPWFITTQILYIMHLTCFPCCCCKIICSC